jgi:hypothetical protein
VKLSALRVPAITAIVIGFGCTALGRVLAPQEFARSYLIALLFWLGLALGALALFMLHNLVGGAWGFMIRRNLEAALPTLPAMAVLFLPIFFGLDDLYLWADHHHAEHDPLIRHKASYLNVEFFLIRFAIYFIIWCAFAALLRKWSAQQDESADRNPLRKMQYLSGIGLVIYGLTITFASVDWVMSITPHWTSTIFGMIFMIAQSLTALAFSTFAAGRLVMAKRIEGPELEAHFNDLGNLLFAFVMLWAYLMLSQFLIIWSADLPEETPWYLLRSSGLWGAMTVALLVLHFAAPLLLLLNRSVKRNVRILSPTAAYLALMGFADVAYLVSPALERWSPPIHWVSLAAFLGIGGVWVLIYSFSLSKRPLIPRFDPRVPEGLRFVEEAPR